MHSQRNVGVLERISKPQIGGRIVGWVAAQDDQDVDLSAAHVRDQIFQGFSLIYWVCIHRIGIEHGATHIAQRSVDSVNKSMDSRRLVISGNNGAGAAMAFQVLDNPVQKLLLLLRNHAAINVVAEQHAQRSRN